MTLAVWIGAALLPTLYWPALWGCHYMGYDQALHMLLVCAGIVSPLIMMMFVVLLSPDNMFEAVTEPLFTTWYKLVGVDPDDPDLFQDSSEEEIFQGAVDNFLEATVEEVGEEDGEEEPFAEFDPDDSVFEEDPGDEDPFANGDGVNTLSMFV